MSTLLLTHSSSLKHDMGRGHPEQPARIAAVEATLAAEEFAGLTRETAPLGMREAILRVHPQSHIALLEAASPRQGYAALDGDTMMNPATLDAAFHAVGAGCRGVDAVLTGVATNAFAAMRPPGHHAETNTAMGFCFFNSIAIAARHAQAVHGVERVAIVDFDVHHGNGTQEIFWNDASVLFASTHQMPLYPGSGALSETGTRDTIVNAPLRPGDGGEAFRAAMEARILPRVAAFAPDLILVSAGFDAHRRDPLASLALVEDDFGWITRKLMDVAHKHASGRIVSLLEGGYDLEALAGSAAAHVGALMEAE